jgi:single-strand DNA-binding protein
MAAGDTQITIAGNLVDDPELRFTPAGQPVAKFRVASTPRFRDNSTGEWKDGDSLFLTCNVWRQAAENVAESLTRGMRVIVSGRLRQRSYETKEGEKRTVYEVEVDDVGPSLRNASAKVNRAARSGAGGGPAGPGGAGGRPPGGQGNAGGAGTDPWASDSSGSYTDEPPFWAAQTSSGGAAVLGAQLVLEHFAWGVARQLVQDHDGAVFGGTSEIQHDIIGKTYGL